MGRVLRRQGVNFVEGDYRRAVAESQPELGEQAVTRSEGRPKRLDDVQQVLHHPEDGESLSAVDEDREHFCNVGLVPHEVADTEGLPGAGRTVHQGMQGSRAGKLAREAVLDLRELVVAVKRRAVVTMEGLGINNQGRCPVGHA